MFDTVGIRCEGRLRRAEHIARGSQAFPFGNGWMALPRGGCLYRVEGSLKHYNHGHLPQTEAEMKTALAIVFEDIHSLAEIQHWWFCRLDLARDVAEPTEPLVRACRQWRFPCIRKPACVEDDDSCIRWGNGRTECQVQIYNAAKKHRLPAPMTRLEVSLKRRQVVLRELHREVLWAKLVETFAEFADMLPDTSPELPTGKLTDGQIVACLGKIHGAAVAQTLLGLLKQSRSRPTIRKIRQQFAAGFAEQGGKSPKAAFALPRVPIGKNLSTVPSPNALPMA